MKNGKLPALALVTAPNLKTARKLAGLVLKERLAACVNLVPKLESHYWWQGKVTAGAEVLMLIKTSSSRLAPLEKLVITNHPYDTPEFVVLQVKSVNSRYLAWWMEALAGF